MPTSKAILGKIFDLSFDIIGIIRMMLNWVRTKRYEENKMTLPNPGSWQGIIEDAAPQLFKDVTTVRDNVLTDGALSMKVKVLMTMLCDALLAHDHGVENIANRARASGATEDEIAETIGVAFVMGGTPALVTGSNAFKKS